MPIDHTDPHPALVVAVASAHQLTLCVRDIVFASQVTATWTPV
jgi:PIN domain nuclease of toxin-antitoxin system